MREGAAKIEKQVMAHEKKLWAVCPVCGYKMPISYTEEARCNGALVSCKGRNCHSVFELKIKDGKQIL